MKLAIIIPVYHQQHLTDALMGDIYEQQDSEMQVYIVDNGNDYVPTQKVGEIVLKPKKNLRWTKGSNHGLKVSKGWDPADAYVLLNNDTRLSRGFFVGLREALEYNPKAGVVAPLYDDVWPQQRGVYAGVAGSYTVSIPPPLDAPVGFVDGTCMAITHRCLTDIGFLDEEHFGEYGWGGDFDYCIRARQFGYDVIVTHRSFLNHLHQGTASTMGVDWNHLAGSELNTGMNAKYGPNWQELLEL